MWFFTTPAVLALCFTSFIPSSMSLHSYWNIFFRQLCPDQLVPKKIASPNPLENTKMQTPNPLPMSKSMESFSTSSLAYYCTTPIFLPFFCLMVVSPSWHSFNSPRLQSSFFTNTCIYSNFPPPTLRQYQQISQPTFPCRQGNLG
jgi:hypothetical protein